MINTILLTWTLQISGQSDHQVRSTKIRLSQYITNIVKYIVDSPFKNIIFCENSNYNISREKEIIEYLSQLYWKTIEFIQFQWDSLKTQQQGRGYGESEIMEYAMNNSMLLNNDILFVKITGRYFLTNSWDFVEKNNYNQTMFVRMIPFQKQCSTACYITTPIFYRNNLRWMGLEVDDHKGKKHQLEWVFYTKLKTINWKFRSMNVLPIMKAITWSGYILEPHTIKDAIKQFLNTLWLYRL